MAGRLLRVVGILGGMGPEATIWLMQRVLALTPAEDDADHVPLLVDNNTQVPSRISAIIEQDGEDPTPVLVGMARKLEAAGATALAMPCNTAHFYADAIRASVGIPFLDMPELTARHVALSLATRAGQPARRVGMLASPAVRMTGVFEQPFREAGIEPLYPDDDGPVLESIRDVKAGRIERATFERLEAVVSGMSAAGAEVVVIACSELSIVKDRIGGALPRVDSIEVLAHAVVGFSIEGRVSA